MRRRVAALAGTALLAGSLAACSAERASESGDGETTADAGETLVGGAGGPPPPPPANPPPAPPAGPQHERGVES
ncbi:hypothetical protein QVL82_06660, partial [Cellulosimicrobium funkei]